VPKYYPKLLLVSDIYPEAGSGGAMVLYRLLEQYPADRLLVVSKESKPSGRLPNVTYLSIDNPIPRWMMMRVNPFWPVMMARKSRYLAGSVFQQIDGFKPEAVLTVAQDHLCFVASEISRKKGISFHVIVHDDWSHHQTIRHCHWTKSFGMMACDWMIGGLFKDASSVSCVSDGMAESYAQRYGIKPKVLLPSRGEDLATIQKPQAHSIGRPVFAYAGNIFHPWIVESLNSLADCLATLGGHLDLYITDEAWASSLSWGLNTQRSRHAGFLPPRELVQRIALSSGGLFLPASFHAKDKLDVSTLFPSKLVDYTAAGVPILIWGPEYCSAVRWGKANPMAAAIVTSQAKPALLQGIKQVLDPLTGNQIAQAGNAAGNRDFDQHRICSSFYETISAMDIAK